MSADVDAILERLARVEERLSEHAAGPAPSGLTEPDPGEEERWEAGQVWAHLAEFPGYWLGEVRRVVDGPGSEAVPFGRIKTDPDRIAAIERDRNTDPRALLGTLYPEPRPPWPGLRVLSPSGELLAAADHLGNVRVWPASAPRWPM